MGLFPVIGETLLPGLCILTGHFPVKLIDRMPLEDTESPGGENWVIAVRSVEESQDGSEGSGGPCGTGGEGIYCCYGGP